MATEDQNNSSTLVDLGPGAACPTIRARLANDAARGKATSQQAIRFVRHTCRCQKCRDGRALDAFARRQQHADGWR